MNKESITALLQQVRAGSLPVEAAWEKLKNLPYEDVGFAKIDTHREMRRGFPEVILCEGKTPEQVAHIAGRMAGHSRLVLATRADRSAYEAVSLLPVRTEYRQEANIILIGELPEIIYTNTIAVVSAGTADMPVAEEAALTARAMGNRIDRIFDVGIAGVHRLLENLDRISNAGVVIVTAGMEGALPGVVGGLIDKPVIAVPTSVGYGVSFKGVSALLTMLNSCVPGIGVVNIDNGFGAGYLAALINRLAGGAAGTPERSSS